MQISIALVDEARRDARLDDQPTSAANHRARETADPDPACVVRCDVPQEAFCIGEGAIRRRHPLALTGAPSNKVSAPSPCRTRCVRASRSAAALSMNSARSLLISAYSDSSSDQVAWPWQKPATGLRNMGATPRSCQTCASDTRTQPALTSTLRSGLIASGFFGSVTVSTPFLKLASILSASTPSGSEKERWKAP